MFTLVVYRFTHEHLCIVYMYTHTNTHIPIHIHIQHYTNIYMYQYIYIYINIHMRTYIYIYMHVRINTYMCIYTYTNTISSDVTCVRSVSALKIIIIKQMLVTSWIVESITKIVMGLTKKSTNLNYHQKWVRYIIGSFDIVHGDASWLLRICTGETKRASGQYVAVCCSVVQCGAAWCSVTDEAKKASRRCPAEYYGVLQRGAVFPTRLWKRLVELWQCIAVCCSVLQCVAVCCSVVLSYRRDQESESSMRDSMHDICLRFDSSNSRISRAS